MKEFLNKETYEFVRSSSELNDMWIEIPEGANIYAVANDGIFTFWNDDYQWLNGRITRHIKLKDPKYTFKEWSLDWDAKILWQRQEQPEELPIIDDEQSLNDRYAEIEKVREKHSHYKKDISHLNVLDVYRVLELFNVTNPCIQHAVKKLLCSGQRGVKDSDRDVNEAIDSLQRYNEMKIEDDNS